uniref:Uncharacterized protein n=1 Tax=Syphacia muris TaxID=451379 RepID=A0A0N5ACW7_9BILA
MVESRSHHRLFEMLSYYSLNAVKDPSGEDALPDPVVELEIANGDDGQPRPAPSCRRRDRHERVPDVVDLQEGVEMYEIGLPPSPPRDFLRVTNNEPHPGRAAHHSSDRAPGNRLSFHHRLQHNESDGVERRPTLPVSRRKVERCRRKPTK